MVRRLEHVGLLPLTVAGIYRQLSAPPTSFCYFRGSLPMVMVMPGHSDGMKHDAGDAARCRPSVEVMHENVRKRVSLSPDHHDTFCATASMRSFADALCSASISS